MRVVVAHEWLTNWAGSERVAKQMVELTHCDELVSSVVDPVFFRQHLNGPRVRALWPSRLPGATTHWSRYAPAMLSAWASVKIRADLLLVSSHFAAHGATFRFDGALSRLLPSASPYSMAPRYRTGRASESDPLCGPAHRIAAATGMGPSYRTGRDHDISQFLRSRQHNVPMMLTVWVVWLAIRSP